MLRYTLFKSPRSADVAGCQMTQDIVRYAHAVFGKDIRPTHIFERNYPRQVTSLPSIYDWEQQQYYVGNDAVTKWYKLHGFSGDLAAKWAALNADCRINDNLLKKCAN